MLWLGTIKGSNDYHPTDKYSVTEKEVYNDIND